MLASAGNVAGTRRRLYRLLDTWPKRSPLTAAPENIPTSSGPA
jgi:hypothetical protein